MPRFQRDGGVGCGGREDRWIGKDFFFFFEVAEGSGGGGCPQQGQIPDVLPP